MGEGHVMKECRDFGRFLNRKGERIEAKTPHSLDY
jgi:hypothetical protein